MLIATRGFRARQNSYGFRAIWSWKFVEFEKNRSVATGPGDSPIKNCFVSIEDLPIGFNCTEGIFQRRINCTFLLRIQKNPPETHWNHKCGFPVKLIGIVENPAVFFWIIIWIQWNFIWILSKSLSNLSRFRGLFFFNLNFRVECFFSPNRKLLIFRLDSVLSSLKKKGLHGLKITLLLKEL